MDDRKSRKCILLFWSSDLPFGRIGTLVLSCEWLGTFGKSILTILFFSASRLRVWLSCCLCEVVFLLYGRLLLCVLWLFGYIYLRQIGRYRGVQLPDSGWGRVFRPALRPLLLWLLGWWILRWFRRELSRIVCTVVVWRAEKYINMTYVILVMTYVMTKAESQLTLAALLPFSSLKMSWRASETSSSHEDRKLSRRISQRRGKQKPNGSTQKAAGDL